MGDNSSASTGPRNRLHGFSYPMADYCRRDVESFVPLDVFEDLGERLAIRGNQGIRRYIPCRKHYNAHSSHNLRQRFRRDDGVIE